LILRTMNPRQHRGEKRGGGGREEVTSAKSFHISTTFITDVN
jgi:hypothetical protein